MAFQPDFDVYQLPAEHTMLRAAVRSLCDDKIAPRAAEIDQTAEFPHDVLAALTSAGFHAVHVPAEYGGEGADSIAQAIVIEEVARVCASSALIPAVNKLGTMGMILAASEDVKQEFLPGLANGEGMWSYALSEREAGSDAASMKTRAVRDGEDWVLSGTKCWITNAGISSHYTVMAVTDPEKGANGISSFVVNAEDPGFSVGTKERKLGIHGSPTCEIYFENVRLPQSRMIGAEGTGFKTALKTLDHTRMAIGAQALGIAQGALEQAISYAKERQQFGKPIASFQGIQFMIADMAMAVEASRQLVYWACSKAERMEPDLTYASAAAKAFASDTAMKVTTDAVQIFGGYGYTQDFPVERMMRDAKITQIYEGTNQIQRMVMARSLLK